jgi:formamidopyrimidine-DNA glycosylase
MPELPEVENVARALRRNLVGRRLTDLKVRFKGVLSDSPRIVRRELVGKTLQAVQRHGKYLILRFADGGQRGGSLIRDSDLAEAHWMIHLRMTGQIFILPGYRPDKHVHLTLDFEGLPVYYRDIRKFGRFALVEDGVRPAALSHIGPDMLDVAFAEWYERIAVRRAPGSGPALAA